MCRCSSVGQSNALVKRRSGVRIPSPARVFSAVAGSAAFSQLGWPPPSEPPGPPKPPPPPNPPEGLRLAQASIAFWKDEEADPLGRGRGLADGRAVGRVLGCPPAPKWCPDGSVTPCSERHFWKAANPDVDELELDELELVVPAELALHPVTASTAVSAAAPISTGRADPLVSCKPVDRRINEFLLKMRRGWRQRRRPRRCCAVGDSAAARGDGLPLARRHAAAPTFW